MSTTPESELDLDLQLLPAWAQQPPAVNKYAKFEGEDPERGFRRDRQGGRDNRPGGRRNEPRRDGPSGGPRRPSGPGGGGGGGGARFGRDRGPRGESDRFRPEAQQAPPTPPPDIDVFIRPEEKGVESLARQIKLTGRAYPLFGIASIILKKPDRFQISFKVIKKADGSVVQPLWGCNLDDTVWLSEAEAVTHVLAQHFSTFYQTEKIATDAPKGIYTFVAQCGFSGTILGPPNYHDYQNKLRKLHADRFSRMAFEAFKARVKIVKDEAVVKQWLDDQSWKTEFICLNLPEPKRLYSRDEVEAHFREVHLPNIIKQIDSFTCSGAESRSLPCGALRTLARNAWDDQMRFPLKLVTILSQQLAGHGLQFFKVNKSITHVAVARPHYLDIDTTPVSEGIRRIVNFINSHNNCTRRKLLDGLAPFPKVPAGSVPVAAPAEAPAPGEAATAPAEPPPTPEQTEVISNLHWLIHQGHVIEFTNGAMETAKKPLPRPTPPPRQPKAPAAPTGTAAGDAVVAPAAGSATAEAEAAPASESDSGVDAGGEAGFAAEAAALANTHAAPERAAYAAPIAPAEPAPAGGSSSGA